MGIGRDGTVESVKSWAPGASRGPGEVKHEKGMANEVDGSFDGDDKHPPAPDQGTIGRVSVHSLLKDAPDWMELGILALLDHDGDGFVDKQEM